MLTCGVLQVPGGDVAGIVEEDGDKVSPQGWESKHHSFAFTCMNVCAQLTVLQLKKGDRIIALTDKYVKHHDGEPLSTHAKLGQSSTRAQHSACAWQVATASTRW